LNLGSQIKDFHGHLSSPSIRHPPVHRRRAIF
jgi:hypothetical protein